MQILEASNEVGQQQLVPYIPWGTIETRAERHSAESATRLVWDGRADHQLHTM